jgi:hypothetical protein
MLEARRIIVTNDLNATNVARSVATTCGVGSAARSDKRGRLVEGLESQTADISETATTRSPRQKKAKLTNAEKKALMKRRIVKMHWRILVPRGIWLQVIARVMVTNASAPRHLAKRANGVVDWHHVCANNYDDTDTTCPCRK